MDRMCGELRARQISGGRPEGGRQAALNVRPVQAGAFSGFIQAPALAGHAGPPPGLGLAQAALAAEDGEGLAETPGVVVTLESWHGLMMAPTGPGREDGFVSAAP
jgi:hypothetical protein